jgi:hypothetical protein
MLLNLSVCGDALNYLIYYYLEFKYGIVPVYKFKFIIIERNSDDLLIKRIGQIFGIDAQICKLFKAINTMP